jgi:prepilin-type N-terminal cleavage/methylation domain-containing protein
MRGVYVFFLSVSSVAKNEMIKRRKQSGFTLAELLMALMVGSIVLAAAATMADAMSCGKQATEQMTRSATYLAQLHTRLSDLVMRAETIEALTGGENKGVKIVCAGETYTIYTDASENILYVHKESDVKPYKYEYKKEGQSEPTQTNVEVKIDDHNVNRVVIRFDITENGASNTYTMTATRRGGT